MAKLARSKKQPRRGGRRTGDLTVLLGGSGRYAAFRRTLLEEFKNNATVRDLAAYALDNGFYTAADQERLLLSAIEDDVRRALGVKDEDGMPFAGPKSVGRDDDEASGPLWSARLAWQVDDYRRFLESRLSQRFGAHVVAVATSRETYTRYNDRLTVPPLKGWEAPK